MDVTGSTLVQLDGSSTLREKHIRVEPRSRSQVAEVQMFGDWVLKIKFTHKPAQVHEREQEAVPSNEEISSAKPANCEREEGVIQEAQEEKEEDAHVEPPREEAPLNG